MAVIYLDDEWLCRMDIVLQEMHRQGEGWEIIAGFVDHKKHDAFWQALWQRQHGSFWPLVSSGQVELDSTESARYLTRGPVFELQGLSDALFFADWVEGHLDSLRDQIQKVSKGVRLSCIEPELIGRHAPSVRI